MNVLPVGDLAPKWDPGVSKKGWIRISKASLVALGSARVFQLPELSTPRVGVFAAAT